MRLPAEGLLSSIEARGSLMSYKHTLRLEYEAAHAAPAPRGAGWPVPCLPSAAGNFTARRTRRRSLVHCSLA